MLDKFKSFFAKLTLIPHIIQQVQVIEQFLPIPAAGKTKLDTIIQMILSVFNDEQQIQTILTSDQIKTTVTNISGILVNAANATGIFKTTQKVA